MARRDHKGLLRALRKSPKDADLWLQLFQILYPAIRYTAGRWTPNRDVANEVTQITCVRLLESSALDSLKSEDEALAYARQAARNAAMDWWRKQRRRESVELSNQDSTAAIVDPAHDIWPDEWFRMDLERLVGTLRHEDQILLRLMLLGMGTKEVAQHLGISYSAAAQRMHRVRNLLRRMENWPM